MKGLYLIVSIVFVLGLVLSMVFAPDKLNAGTTIGIILMYITGVILIMMARPY